MNGCDYCLAAHSYVSTKLAKIPSEEIALNRQGQSSDPKRRAAVAFAKALIETRGKVSDAQFAAVKDAGWTDANLVEMIALTAQMSEINEHIRVLIFLANIASRAGNRSLHHA